MMRLPKMDHRAPGSVAEACSLIEEHGAGAKVLAGGTDLLAACKLRNVRPAMLISLRGIEALRGIEFQEGEGLRIGAMTRLHQLRYDPSIQEHYPALARAAGSVGAVQLQLMGTLGGNLCLNTRCIYYNQSETWRKSRAVCLKMGGDVCHVVPKGERCYAVFSGDTAPVLIALDAKARLISSREEREISLRELYTGDGKEPIALRSGELLQEVRIPPARGTQSSIYLKYRKREAIDFPMVGVAVRMDSNGEGVCTECKVVLNAVGSAPSEVPEAGKLLKGKVPTAALIDEAAEWAEKQAHPVANTAGSTPSY
ncbi:MAG: FAD binding domain-containing protein, partial [Desulfobacterales bacterium]|nr:FAD binding domain-containing protein [Desulfobacterales bacterium]